MTYKDEINFLLRTEDSNDPSNQRNKIADIGLDELKLNNLNIPIDYLIYLQEIGEGSFREGQFKVFGYLLSFDDIGLGGIYDTPDNIKIFGDNFSGDFACFDLSSNKNEVIEFWHDSEELYYTGKAFREYIREQMLMDEVGNDLRE